MWLRACDRLRIGAGAVCLAVAALVLLLHLLAYRGASPLDDFAWLGPLRLGAGATLLAAVVLPGAATGHGDPGPWPAAAFVVGLAYFVALVVARNALIGDYRYDGRTGDPADLADGTFALVNAHDGVVARLEEADYRWLRRLRFLVSSAFCIPFFVGVGLACVLGQQRAGPGAAPDRAT